MRIRDIPIGQKVWVNPPWVQANLTGVQAAIVARNGSVTLRYTDYTTETGRGRLKRDMEIPCYIGLIEFVQDQRKRGLGTIPGEWEYK